jgi:hypothetical protein
MVDRIIWCQTLLDDDSQCPREATSLVRGRPGYLWSGYHCDEHAAITATHYEHQGGCVVERLATNGEATDG